MPVVAGHPQSSTIFDLSKKTLQKLSASRKGRNERQGFLCELSDLGYFDQRFFKKRLTSSWLPISIMLAWLPSNLNTTRMSRPALNSK